MTSKERVKSKKLANGEIEIISTNACGFLEVTFSIDASTNRIGEKFITDERIGEWCRIPYDLGDRYFLVIESGKVISADRVVITDSLRVIAHIDHDRLDYIKEDTELSLKNLIVEPIPEFTAYPAYLNPKDPDVLEFVENSDSLEIINYGEKLVVVITKGVILDKIFPDIEAYPN